MDSTHLEEHLLQNRMGWESKGQGRIGWDWIGQDSIG